MGKTLDYIENMEIRKCIANVNDILKVGKIGERDIKGYGENGKIFNSFPNWSTDASMHIIFMSLFNN